MMVAQGTLKARKLVAYREQMVTDYGRPQYIQRDNGPKLIRALLVKFGLKHSIESRYTQPGKPRQNGLVERLNGIVRKECLNLQVFKTIIHVQDSLEVCGAARAISIILKKTHSALKYVLLTVYIRKGSDSSINWLRYKGEDKPTKRTLWLFNSVANRLPAEPLVKTYCPGISSTY